MNNVFFDLFRTLEENLQGTPEMDFLERYSLSMRMDQRLQPYYDEMRFFKYLRNIEAHRNDSMDYFVITDQSINLLKKILDYVLFPIRAYQIGSTVDVRQLPTLDSLLLPLIKIMHLGKILYMPVLGETNQLIGIFSDEVLFHSFIKNHKLQIDQTTLLRQFEKLILFDNHLSESFRFIDKMLPLQAIEKIFQQSPLNGKPITCLLVTEHGKSTETLLRIITPWDVLKIPPLNNE